MSKGARRGFKMAGMDRRQRIQFFALLFIGLGVTAAFGIWWFEPHHIAQNFGGAFHLFDYVLFVVLTYIVWHQIVMELFAWYVAAHVKEPDRSIVPEDGLRVAYCTAFVPGAEPYSILERTLEAMVGVDYPHDTWLLDEGDDAEAKAICKRHGVHHYSRKGKDEFNTDSGRFVRKTKGGNYNSWLHHHDQEYDIVAQHDVDFIPRKDFLVRSLGYFRDPSVAFVGGPQVYGNLDESWIARGAAEQTYGFYGLMQKGFYGLDMTLLIGANHLVRTEAYRDIDGYAAHIAEDMLTGMKLYAHKSKWKSVYLPDALLLGEGPSTWVAYFGQQMRWAYGCMDIVFRYAPGILPKMSLRRIFNYVVLQQFYFSGVAQVAGVCLLTLYFLFGVSPGNLGLTPILELYVPLVLYQFIFQLWLQRLNVDPKTERGFFLRGKLLSLASLPIFFLAFMGVIRGKRLTYIVTPKGAQQETERTPSLFVPHFILGSITLIDMVFGVALRHVAGPMIFWAALNTLCMYAFFFSEAAPAFVFRAKRTFARAPIVPVVDFKVAEEATVV